MTKTAKKPAHKKTVSPKSGGTTTLPAPDKAIENTTSKPNKDK